MEQAESWGPYGTVQFVSRPVVQVEGYPALPDETTDQYVRRVMPLVWVDLDRGRQL